MISTSEQVKGDPSHESQWQQVSVRVAVDRVDVVAQLLIQAGCNGAIQQDDPDGSTVIGYLPVTIAGADHGDPPPSLTDALRRSLDLAAQELGGIEVDSLSLASVSAEDWSVSWKDHFPPIDVGHRFRIQPSWHDRDLNGASDGDRIVLTLDPGMAFGTGHHSTTRFCLELLEEYICPGDAVADLGTGSGILAIAAVRLGAGRVVAVDNDPLTMDALRENCARNRILPSQIEALCCDLSQCPKGPYNLVVANLTSPEIARLSARVEELLAPEGRFVGSGVSLEHRAEVEAALHRSGLRIEKSLVDGEWMAFAAHIHTLGSTAV